MKERRFAIKISIVILVVLLVISAILFVGAYKYSQVSEFAASIYTLVPIPAARVDGSLVNLGKFNQNVAAVKNFYENQDFSSVEVEVDFEGPDGDFYEKNIQRIVLNRMVDDAVARKLLKKEYDVKVSQDKIDADFESVLVDYGSAETSEAELKRLYGWDLDDFKNQIVEPQMNLTELEKRVIQDDSIEQNQQAKNQITEVLAKVQSGEDFATMAKEYSQGPSASLGGDLGCFKEGVMVPEFEEVAFSLSEGETSDIVRSRYGYHIIKIEDIKGVEIRARHILIRTKTFEEWFKEKKQEMSIKIWVNGLKYDQEETQVIFEKEEYNDRVESL